MDRFSLRRRSYLTLVAAGAIPATAVPVQAATGYGTGGYGQTAYGVGDDSTDEGDSGTGGSDGGSVIDDYPVIQQFDLSDSSPPNPHVSLVVKWTVAHEDAALSSVYVEVRSRSGREVGTATTAVAGAEASGTDIFTIDHATGDTFVVSIFVTDTAENTATDFDRLDTSRRSSMNSNSRDT